MLEAQDVYFARDRFYLRRVNLTIAAGKISVICGNNGVGKSTLINMLSGYLQPISGRVCLGGTDIRGICTKQLAQMRSLLPQRDETSDYFSVQEFLDLAKYALPQPCQSWQWDKLCSSTMRDLQIVALQGRPLGSISGGERQRVRIAHALLQVLASSASPRFALLDEPLSSLDVQFQKQVMRLLHKAVGCGVGIVAVVHDLTTALRHADHVVVMQSDGKITQGTAAHLLTENYIEKTFGIEVKIVDFPAKTIIPV